MVSLGSRDSPIHAIIRSARIAAHGGCIGQPRLRRIVSVVANRLHAEDFDGLFPGSDFESVAAVDDWAAATGAMTIGRLKQNAALPHRLAFIRHPAAGNRGRLAADNNQRRESGHRQRHA